MHVVTLCSRSRCGTREAMTVGCKPTIEVELKRPHDLTSNIYFLIFFVVHRGMRYCQSRRCLACPCRAPARKPGNVWQKILRIRCQVIIETELSNTRTFGLLLNHSPARSHVTLLFCPSLQNHNLARRCLPRCRKLKAAAPRA